jgi:hypothetical protein
MNVRVSNNDEKWQTAQKHKGGLRGEHREKRQHVVHSTQLLPHLSVPPIFVPNAPSFDKIRSQTHVVDQRDDQMHVGVPIRTLRKTERAVIVVQEITEVQNRPRTPNEIHRPRFANDQRDHPEKKIDEKQGNGKPNKVVVVFVIFEHGVLVV